MDEDIENNPVFLEKLSADEREDCKSSAVKPRKYRNTCSWIEKRNYKKKMIRRFLSVNPTMDFSQHGGTWCSPGIYSPQNGIGLMSTTDFRQYTDCGVTTLYQSDWTWAKDRITAGFVLDISELDYPYRYAMFFHGDNEDNYLFGASIGVVFGDDLHTWEIPS